MTLGRWFIEREVAAYMTDVLKKFGGLIVKIIPGEGIRTILIAILYSLYSVIAATQGTMTWEQAATNVGVAIGLLTAASHKPS